MAFQWTSDLETGNALIDREHKQLFEAINGLLDACSMGKGRTELEKTTKFLLDYTKLHFGDEEKLQLQYKYPDYANHKRYHDTFVNVVSDISKQLHQEGPTIALVGQVNQKIGQWLIQHVKGEDVKVARYIKSHS